MIRKGRIQTFNKFNGLGIIIDENDQEISFSVESLVEWPRADEEVTFDIALTALGLMATDIIPIYQRMVFEEKAELMPDDLPNMLLQPTFIRPVGKI